MIVLKSSACCTAAVFAKAFADFVLTLKEVEKPVFSMNKKYFQPGKILAKLYVCVSYISG